MMLRVSNAEVIPEGVSYPKTLISSKPQCYDGSL